MAKHIHVKVWPRDADEKQETDAKTARLRALRLVKEAADSEAAQREIAAVVPKSRARQADRPTSRAS